MVADIRIHQKSFGDKELFSGLDIALQEGEVVGLIGGNGTGKSTLLHMIDGDEGDYDGEIQIKKNILKASTAQEHTGQEDIRTLDYILEGLPEYTKLKHIIETYPDTMGEATHLLHEYGEALERFGVLGYYDVEQQIMTLFASYQLDEAILDMPFTQLSGGQKRLVELIKAQQSKAHLLLIDEPTNHMDYVAKAAFLSWLKQSKSAMLIVTHDRDVLKNVGRIIEIRDKQAYSYPGDYDDYLRSHTNRVTSAVNEHEVVERRKNNLEKDAVRFQRLKERGRDPGTIQRFKGLEQKARTELDELKGKEKPTFWIDKNSKANLSPKLNKAYERHKSRTIHIEQTQNQESEGMSLVKVKELSLGYEQPLFAGLDFELRTGEKLELRGRNGVGKTTFVQALLAYHKGEKPDSKVFKGSIEIDNRTRIGMYEQEINVEDTKRSLGEAIERAYREQGLSITTQRIRQLLSSYLFNPATDFDRPVSILSGGQKARLQIIRMLATKPNLLILDEPTNHLDLPSIEELENVLEQYKGALLYISHDEYFSEAMGGHALLLDELTTSQA